MVEEYRAVVTLRFAKRVEFVIRSIWPFIKLGQHRVVIKYYVSKDIPVSFVSGIMVFPSVRKLFIRSSARVSTLAFFQGRGDKKPIKRTTPPMHAISIGQSTITNLVFIFSRNRQCQVKQRSTLSHNVSATKREQLPPGSQCGDSSRLHESATSPGPRIVNLTLTIDKSPSAYTCM
jgi:hypothetical protein